ncbi:DUF58 domain-containing protein [Acidisoma cellulosilytica]|uniref:DUF58 domain-containing protein n=1 Tax=Acidisoma cellulosilyticum TaxID=2802395 RepID=A0A963Z2M1_9PROT|nr:DUF58 domain-containing protein [Acidisoma cellulosilyticum]MCB8880730.1 DUF58 domain-containing protein [Acidisoma cellulosilyticum]
MALSSPKPLAALKAEALGQTLPPLLLAAERVATTVAQGVHGRRRTGRGDSFWQYRPFAEGDGADRIDWRQSGRSDRLFVRETEWEAAQTAYLWVADGAAMRWHSADAAPKRDRAVLLALALASLLLRGGEYVRLLGAAAHPASGRAALPAIAGLLDQTEMREQPLPPRLAVPRHAHVILIGDFLEPLDSVQAAVTGFAALPVTGHILQVLDPAEADLPFRGRVRFQGLGNRQAGGSILVPKVETIRAEYQKRLQAQIAGLGAIAGAAGWKASLHRTDHAPNTALLALYEALANR